MRFKKKVSGGFKAFVKKQNEWGWKAFSVKLKKL